jgi:hypothetical protein
MSRNNLALVQSEATFAEAMARAGQGSFQNPTTLAALANHANSTAPVAATLSNTAAGYAKLGGLWSAAALAGADTDYALFAYQVPSDRSLYLTGIDIATTIVTGAANATTATILQWGLGVNSTAVSLATTDSGATYGPRRIPLGMQSCLASLAIGGQIGPDVIRRFNTPIQVLPSRYVHIILAIPVCTATSSEVLRGAVTVNGFFG